MELALELAFYLSCDDRGDWRAHEIAVNESAAYLSVCVSRALASFKPHNTLEPPCSIVELLCFNFFYQDHRIQSISSQKPQQNEKLISMFIWRMQARRSLRDITTHPLINLNCFMYSLLQIGVTVRWTFPVPKMKPLVGLIGIQHETSNT